LTAEELRDRLAELGWTQTELSRRVQVNDRTVRRWIEGTYRVPGAVSAFLASQKPKAKVS